jgi:thiol-disulfide isomerase/thioredoxin
MMQVLCIVKFKFLKMKRFALLMTMVLSLSLNAQIKIGDSIADIVIKDSNNQEVKVSSTGNKFFLIDFCPPWCASCRVANREFAKLKSKYINADFKSSEFH